MTVLAILTTDGQLEVYGPVKGANRKKVVVPFDNEESEDTLYIFLNDHLEKVPWDKIKTIKVADI